MLYNKAATKLEVYPPALEAASYDVASTVTAIGDYAFYNNDVLTTISLPSGVASIGSMAFANVEKLVALTIKATTPVGVASTTFDGLLDFATLFVPSGSSSSYRDANGWSNFSQVIESSNPTIATATVDHFDYLLVGSNAIASAYNLESWEYYDEVIPATITVGNSTYTITGCMPQLMENTSCPTLTIEAAITTITKEMFHDSSIQEVVLPESVTTIAEGAFMGCGELRYINFPEGLTTIETTAFIFCSNLNDVSLPASITEIGAAAFSSCSILYSVEIARTEPLDISENVFSGISEYSILTVPFGCKQAYQEATGWNVFNTITSAPVSSLPSVIIDDIIYALYNDEQAFVTGYNVIEPVNLDIPASITTEGTTYSVTMVTENAFAECSSLKTVVIPSSVHTIEPWAFYWCPSLTTVTIPEGVTYIGNYAFCNSDQLTTITLPEGLTYLGKSALAWCSSLTDITLPSTLTTISNKLFVSCLSLTQLVIPEGVEEIEEYAISGCLKLVDLSLPSTLTSIAENAFSGCYNLMSVSVAQSTPLDIDSDLFEDIAHDATLYVPVGSKSLYESATGWDFFVNIVEGDAPATSLESIDNLLYLVHDTYATVAGFVADATIGDITIPSKVVVDNVAYPVYNIGTAAFYGCTTLGSVTIEEGVEVIEMGTFVYSSLAGLSIPASVTTIGESALYEVRDLATIVVDADNPNYSSVDNALFDKEQTTLMLYAPGSTATSYTVPSTVTTLAESAFYGSSNLRSVELNDNLETIESYVFEGCSNLTSLYIPASVIRIGEYLNSDAEAITKVYVASEIPAEVTYYPFNNRDNITLYVPIGCKEVYEATEYWNEFAEIVEMDVTSDMSATVTTTTVAAANGAIVVEGAAVGTTIVIYNTAGWLVYSGIATNATTTVSLPTGLYIVCVEGQAATRVVVK